MDAVGHETDLMPTFLEIAGAKYPAKVEAGALPPLVGQSLTPIFAGLTRTRYPIFWEHEGNKAGRDGKWKLVSRFPEGWELFDREGDRTEMHNLAKEQSPRVKAIANMYSEWANLIGVQPWPMPETPPSERTGALEMPEYLKKY